MEETATPIRYADCYVLTNRRSKDFIFSFLDTFMPDREEYATTYEVPQFAEQPSQTFTSADELLSYLSINTNEAHAVYWYNKINSTLQGAMCLFYEDGWLVVGLCCQTLYPDTSIEERYTKQLQKFCDSTLSCILYEEPAPRTTEAFMQKGETPDTSV